MRAAPIGPFGAVDAVQGAIGLPVVRGRALRRAGLRHVEQDRHRDISRLRGWRWRWSCRHKVGVLVHLDLADREGAIRAIEGDHDLQFLAREHLRVARNALGLPRVNRDAGRARLSVDGHIERGETRTAAVRTVGHRNLSHKRVVRHIDGPLPPWVRA